MTKKNLLERSAHLETEEEKQKSEERVCDIQATLTHVTKINSLFIPNFIQKSVILSQTHMGF